MIEAKILLDSVNRRGMRLTSFEISIPYSSLRELTKHKTLVSTTRNKINQGGKIALNEIASSLNRNNEHDLKFSQIWRSAGMVAVQHAETILKLEGKETPANRIVEPFANAITLVTATDFSHFFKARTKNHDQQDPIRLLALKMKKLYSDNVSEYSNDHIPYITDQDRSYGFSRDDLCLASAARIARVSEKSLLSANNSIEDDIRTGRSVLESGHMSPFEHIGLSPTWFDYCGEFIRINKEFLMNGKASGNFGTFNGWIQYRKLIENECVNKR